MIQKLYNSMCCHGEAGLVIREDGPFYRYGMDKESNGHNVKKSLRCTISGCFDKYNICCKACDIKKCRYKCNHMHEEECKYQRLD
jgi:hypothetical protein